MDIRPDKARTMDKKQRTERNLYQRGGIWYARTTVNGRELRRSLQTADRAEAKRRLKAWLSENTVYHGTVRKQFDDVMAEYLASIEGSHKAATVARYETSARMLTAHFAGRWWDQVTTAEAHAYIAERKAQQVSIATIRRDMTTLSQASEYAMERGWGGINVVRQVGKRPLRYRTPTFKRPDDVSVERLISGAYGNIKHLARFLLATGMRMMEGASLTRAQVDFRRAIATLPVTKNGTVRTVDLSDEAMAILRAMPKVEGSDLFFPSISRINGKPHVYRQPSTNWNEQAKALIAKHPKERLAYFNIHALRHLYAIRVLEKGESLYWLQKQLGHGSIKQTEAYLAFLSPTEQEGAKQGSAQSTAQPQRFSLADGDENG
ncbi:XerC Integrase [uncultured Caudovirales phage]|uniref:Integrase n=1 Tax=uncultured Caudovirales phage TaxID=2100421 RepID=A0A6J5LSV7_9CAUD|nr:XerC Integrase [uncultured Caudovirales phage]